MKKIQDVVNLRGVMPLKFNWDQRWQEWQEAMAGHWTYRGEGTRTLAWYDSFSARLFQKHLFLVKENAIFTGYQKKSGFEPEANSDWSDLVAPWKLIERFQATYPVLEFQFLDNAGRLLGSLAWTFGPMVALEIRSVPGAGEDFLEHLELPLQESGFKPGNPEFFWGEELFQAGGETKGHDLLFMQNPASYLRSLQRYFQGYLSSGDPECLRTFRRKLRAIRFIDEGIPPLMKSTGQLTRLSAHFDYLRSLNGSLAEASVTSLRALRSRFTEVLLQLETEGLGRWKADWQLLHSRLILRNFQELAPLFGEGEAKAIKKKIRQLARAIPTETTELTLTSLTEARKQIRQLKNLLVQNPDLFSGRKCRVLVEALQYFLDLSGSSADAVGFLQSATELLQGLGAADQVVIGSLLGDFSTHWNRRLEKNLKNYQRALGQIHTASQWLKAGRVKPRG